MSIWKKLGVIGGMGPAATVRLFQRIVELTCAESDQEHLDVTILCDPAIPDRTGFLLGAPGARDFVPVLRDKASKLASLGCDVIVMPCNTSHSRYDEIASAAPGVTFLHMPRATVEFARALGCARPLILATDGTIASGVFQTAFKDAGLDWVIPDSTVQANVMTLIYDYVKAGKTAPESLQRTVLDSYRPSGADGIILGCTELSTLGIGFRYKDAPVIDALDVLAWRAVKTCGAPVVDLAASYERSRQG